MQYMEYNMQINIDFSFEKEKILINSIIFVNVTNLNNKNRRKSKIKQ